MGKLIIILQANIICFYTRRSQIAETVKKYISEVTKCYERPSGSDWLGTERCLLLNCFWLL